MNAQRSQQEVDYDVVHAKANKENRRRSEKLVPKDPEAEKKERLERLVKSKKPATAAGSSRKPRLSKKEAKKQARQKAQRFATFFDPTGKKVTVDLAINPIAGIYRSGGISTPQFAAAGRFQKDYNDSQYASMRCRGFEPGVDGGKAVSANLNAVAAQRVLANLREHLGNELFMLMEMVVGRGVTFSEIHAKGGDEAKVISDRLRTALNKAATFYSYQRAEPESRTLRALQELWQDMVAKTGFPG